MKMLFQKQESCITWNPPSFHSGHRGVMLSNGFPVCRTGVEAIIHYVGWEKEHTTVTFKTLKFHNQLNIICQKTSMISGSLSYNY